MAELNLVALRKFACENVRNNKDWFLKCLDCEKLPICGTGKRARDILETNTVPKGAEKIEVDSFQKRLKELEKELKDRPDSARYFEAFKTDDPVQYFVDKGYYTQKWRCRDMLKKWLGRHNIPYDPAILGGAVPGKVSVGEVLRTSAHDSLLDIFGDAKTIKELEERYIAAKGKLPHFTLVYKWARLYPDIGEKYPIKEWGRKLNADCNEEKDENEMTELDIDKETQSTDDDEISVEDFLSETEEPKDVAAIDVASMHPTSIVSDSTFGLDSMKAQFLAKAATIESESKKIDEQILELQKKKLLFDEEIDLLNKTAKLFGFDID